MKDKRFNKLAKKRSKSHQILHGHITRGYSAGCRCKKCVEANEINPKQRKNGHPE